MAPAFLPGPFFIEATIDAASVSTGDEERGRLDAIQVELDQCWDLLRQRRALREFGEDPDKARVRDAGTVENYEQ